MPEGNPLVADAKKDPDGPGAFTAGNGDYGWAGGIGIAESSMDAFNGIKDGDWVSGGLGVLSLAGEIAGAAIDPFGYLMSSVASFLMEHVQPLKDMLDSVAGNPPVIQSYADTWGNVSKALGERKTDFDNAVKNGTTGWTGAGADAYRKFATEHSDALSGAATVAGAISTVTMIMGQVVSFVRETVRQLIADLIGKLISWVMEEVFSLGFGTPVVVAQASAAIAKWGKKIGELLKKLTDTIRRVSPLLSKLVDLFEKIAKVFGKVLGKVSGLDGLKVKEGGFVRKIPKEGGGAHPRAHGGADGESAPDTAPDGSHGGDPDSPSADSSPDPGSRRNPSRDGSPEGDNAPTTHGDDSAPTHAGDGDSTPSTTRSGDNSPSATRSGDGGTPRTGDGSAPHAGDAPTHAGDSAPTHAGDSSPSPARTGDSTPPHGGDSSPSPTRSPSHAGDSSPSPTRTGDNTPPHGGDSTPSPTRSSGDNTPSHADTSPSPTRAGDSSPAPTHSSSPSHTDGGDSPHSGSTPAARSDGPSPHAGSDTPSSAAPPRADGTTSASGTAPTAPRTGDPGTQLPSPRGGDGATAGSLPPQGGGPTGGGMPPGGTPSGGGPGGGSPRTGGGGWTGTPGSPGARTPHVDAYGRPRTGSDLPEGRPRAGGDTPRPRTSDTPAPAPRGFGPGTHGPDTRPSGPGHGPGTRPSGPGHNGPSHSGGPHSGTPGHGPHENGPGHHDPDSVPPHHDTAPRTPDEVNARHAENTPSGSSYHAGDPAMGDLPHRVQPDPNGRYTVDVHVTPDGHARIGNRLYTPEQFADILRRNTDYDGRPIRLIGCDASSNDFAHRLSRELDTEVLAPTKPAWTDSRGRVFSSDYEIGPDGYLRPRIPPDGGWNTHHPDGTTHRAADDGFAPNTHHGDPHDVDADSARHRGDSDEDAAHKKRVHEEIRKVLNGPDRAAAEKLLKKYWQKIGGDGEAVVPRKRIDVLHEGVELPVLRRNKNGEYEIWEPKNAKDYIKAEFKDGSLRRGDRATAPADILDDADMLAAGRPGIRGYVVEANDALKGNLRPDSDFDSPLDEFDQAGFNDVQSNHWSNKLGDLAADHAVRDNLGQPEYASSPLQRVPVPDKGANHFDQVYQDADGRYVIVEAKGPSAGQGGNNGYQQGHPGYVRSILDRMELRPEPEKSVAAEMRKQLDNGELRYFYVQAKVHEADLSSYTDEQLRAMPASARPADRYDGYALKEFDLAIPTNP